MQRLGEYCLSCPRPLSRGVRVQGTAEGCGGRVRLLPGTVATHIDGTKVVRPAGNVDVICGRRWPVLGIEPLKGEYFVTTPGHPQGTDILMVSGADAGFLEGADDDEKLRVVGDYDTELNRGGTIPTDIPAGTPTRGHLAYLRGGADVGHVRAVVGGLVTDDYLGQLQSSRQIAETAQVLVAAELSGSDSPLAAGAIALVTQVVAELDNAIVNEHNMREQGTAYLGCI